MKNRQVCHSFVFALIFSSLLSAGVSASDHPVSVNTTIHRAALSASDQQVGDDFGDAVAVDGNTAVVGAMFTNAAYVFQKPAGGWKNMTQTAKLTPSDNAGHFGAAVAISGDTVVIGAPYTTVNGNVEQGAVYVFVKPASGWKDMTETAKLTGSGLGTSGYDLLGSSVSISGNTIAVGVPNTIQGLGLAFVYVKPQKGWTNSTQTAVLYTDPSWLGFGVAVAVSGDTVVVGANGCCAGGNPTVGEAYVYVKPSSGWTTTSNYNADLAGSDVGSSDFYGESVAIDGDTVLVGSPQTYSSEVGAAYVFVKPPTGWATMVQTAELDPPNNSGEGFFGQSVAISGNQAFIGAPFTKVEGAYQHGAAYVFVRPKNGWQNTAKFNAKLTNSKAYWYFGQSVSVDSTTAVVGFSGTYKTDSGTDVFWGIP